MRPISIPRFELQAATLSVKMYRVLVDELTYKISKATIWSDSQTTLQYIKNEFKRFQTYVDGGEDLNSFGQAVLARCSNV